MSDKPFGQQLKPVNMIITGGDAEDRAHWMNKIIGYLQHQPCDIDRSSTDHAQYMSIYPSANND